MPNNHLILIAKIRWTRTPSFAPPTCMLALRRNGWHGDGQGNLTPKLPCRYAPLERKGQGLLILRGRRGLLLPFTRLSFQFFFPSVCCRFDCGGNRLTTRGQAIENLIECCLQIPVVLG